ncbi:MAG: glycosyltransferase [Pseudonocardiaceae bacterium]|nr:MAG: glycosyltransferase [Pseudonocardiaceae bacterium]
MISRHMQIRIIAAWRHPFNYKKQKIYRTLRKAQEAKRIREPSLITVVASQNKLSSTLALNEFCPKISVIVPNFNHAAFLRQRLDSIISQNYTNLEIIILDDCSTDNSRQIIAAFYARYPNLVKVLQNSRNSGSVFKQWRKGIEASTGDLIWLCESDDFAEPNFVHSLLPYFKDRSVQIAFGRIQFANDLGEIVAGLDAHRDQAEKGIWNAPLVRPACEWFRNGFAVHNVIQNVGGCIFRNQAISKKTWSIAESFSVLGDWYLYLEISRGGRIAYDPKAISYFRQHQTNKSVTSFRTRSYYEEHIKIIRKLHERWSVPYPILSKFLADVRRQYEHHGMVLECDFDKAFETADLRALNRKQEHILIAMLGFHPGGGEFFPLNLANALYSAGALVSIFVLDQSFNADMLQAVEPGIAVYNSNHVGTNGIRDFVVSAGITIIHSHMASVESFFLKKSNLPDEVSYIVTLHGSYECGPLSRKLSRRVVGRVDKFVYTADKNLLPLRQLGISDTKFVKMKNAVPYDARDFAIDRAGLGIDSKAIVFTLVARGILGKGWSETIAAFNKLRVAYPASKVHLVLCGEGEEADRQMDLYGRDPAITFLGYQSRIHGLYRLSDCALVPSRFAGESFPLCLIQALQTGTPIIATRIGEIPNMISPANESPAGLLISPQKDDNAFINELFSSMVRMLDAELRRELIKGSEYLGRHYDMRKLADEYLHLYEATSKKRLDTDSIH